MFEIYNADDWPFGVSDADIRYRVADPQSASVSAFDCGTKWWAKEVNDYVRGKSWADHPKIVALEFGLNGKTVGFAFLILTTKRHPDSAAPVKGPYQAIIYAGMNTKFQGKDDPGSITTPKKEHLSTTMFRGIEEHSRGLQAQPVGLWLQVRKENTRAIAFYEGFGFTMDSKGAFESTDSAHKPTYEMRKPL